MSLGIPTRFSHIYYHYYLLCKICTGFFKNCFSKLFADFITFHAFYQEFFFKIFEKPLEIPMDVFFLISAHEFYHQFFMKLSNILLCWFFFLRFYRTIFEENSKDFFSVICNNYWNACKQNFLVEVLVSNIDGSRFDKYFLTNFWIKCFCSFFFKF